MSKNLRSQLILKIEEEKHQAFIFYEAEKEKKKCWLNPVSSSISSFSVKHDKVISHNTSLELFIILSIDKLVNTDRLDQTTLVLA